MNDDLFAMTPNDCELLFSCFIPKLAGVRYVMVLQVVLRCMCKFRQMYVLHVHVCAFKNVSVHPVHTCMQICAPELHMQLH